MSAIQIEKVKSVIIDLEALAQQGNLASEKERVILKRWLKRLKVKLEV